MKKSMKLSLGSLILAAAGVMFGATPFVTQNSDFVSIRGNGSFEVVNGTVVHMHNSNGEWYGLFSRNNGSQDIELSVEDGTYYVETWSIAANPMQPQRTHKGMEVTIGDGSNPPDDPQPPKYGTPDLLALLAAWGPCAAECKWDLTGNGSVGVPDLMHMLANWGN